MEGVMVTATSLSDVTISTTSGSLDYKPNIIFFMDDAVSTHA